MCFRILIRWIPHIFSRLRRHTRTAHSLEPAECVSKMVEWDSEMTGMKSWWCLHNANALMRIAKLEQTHTDCARLVRSERFICMQTHGIGVVERQIDRETNNNQSCHQIMFVDLHLYGSITTSTWRVTWNLHLYDYTEAQQLTRRTKGIMTWWI